VKFTISIPRESCTNAKAKYSSSVVPPDPSVHFYHWVCGRVYATVRCPSVCLIQLSTAAAACGGFTAESRARRRYRSIANAGAQQQMRAVSCWQPWDEAVHRLVNIVLQEVYHPTSNDKFNSLLTDTSNVGTVITEECAIERWFNFSSHLFSVRYLT